MEGVEMKSIFRVMNSQPLFWVVSFCLVNWFQKVTKKSRGDQHSADPNCLLPTRLMVKLKTISVYSPAAN